MANSWWRQLSNCLRQIRHRAQVDGLIKRVIPAVIDFICGSLGSRCDNLGVHFGVDFGIIFVVLGMFGRPWGAQGPPKGAGRSKKSEKLFLGTLSNSQNDGFVYTKPLFSHFEVFIVFVQIL